MNKVSVPIRFYDCPVPSYDEALHPCDRPILEWLLALTPTPAPWTPQATEIVRIDQATFAAQAAAVADCEASKFASHPAPPDGVALSVSSQLAAAPAGGGEVRDGLRAPVRVDFSPPVACGSILYQVLHRISAVGGGYHPENTVFETSAQPPAKNGTGNFANTIVFDLVNSDTAWRDHVHQVFTGGTWRIRSPRVFSQYSEWEPAGDPGPGAELLARGEAFNSSRLKFEYPDFPDIYGATGPRWLVVHRYTHQQSGRWFYVSDWKSRLNSQNVTWPDAVFGRGHQSDIEWDEFVAPNDGNPAFFDPDGTWLHQSGVIDFAMDDILVQTKYANALCAETWRTINPAGIPDPRTADFLSAQAYFEETVEVRTIRQYKAAYRITGIQSVNGVGALVRVKLINPFSFAACVVARMPFGAGSVASGKDFSAVTVVLVRNLPANAESDEIAYIQPLRQDTALGASVSWTIADIIADALSGGGFSEHGFVCATGAYADGVYTLASSISSASALPATSGNRATMAGFFNAASARYSSIGSASEHSPGEVVFTVPLDMADDPAVPTRGAGNYKILVEFLPDNGVFPAGTQMYVGGPTGDRLYPYAFAMTVAEWAARYGNNVAVSPSAALHQPGANGEFYVHFDSWSGGNATELTDYKKGQEAAVVAANFAAGMYAQPPNHGYFQPPYCFVVAVDYVDVPKSRLVVFLGSAKGSDADPPNGRILLLASNDASLQIGFA